MKIKWNIATLVIVFFPILLLLSCNSDRKKNPVLANMHDEVMEVHDEVMPKISRIKKQQKQLKIKVGSEAYTPEQKSEMTMAINLLEKSEKAMFDWMKAFEKPDYEQTETAAKYYESEMERITTVSQMMYKSMDKGDELLKKYK